MNSPPPMTTNPDLTRLLQKIGLGTLAGHLDDFLARATKGRWSPRQILEELARREYDERAFTLDFIPEGRNLILLGTNGLGKTMILKNLAYQSVLAGYSVLFRTASEILDDLQMEAPELQRRKLKKYARVQVLYLDEVGYLTYDSEAADLLYEIVNRRYECRSLVLTSNKAFKEWNTVFPQAGCLITLLDRLTHHADVTLLEGQSYRVRESEQEAAARRKKR